MENEEEIPQQEEEQEQEQDETVEDFEEQLKIKIAKFFETTPYITSRDELDNFLTAIDLIDQWDSEDEKDTLWQYISKHAKDSKIDCECATQGFNDFLHQDEDQGQAEEDAATNTNQKKEEKEVKETLLTRMSRLSKAIGIKSGNKLALNKYKQRAIDQYDFLDSNSLIQFKKIFTVLKPKIINNKIHFDDLKDICAKYKFIKIDINDIWKYLSYCVFTENVNNQENIKELLINDDIMEEVNQFIDQKILNEDIEYDSDNLEEEDEENADIKENLEEATMNLMEKIINQANNINDNSIVLNEIKKEIKNLNRNEGENNKELINEKIAQIDEYITKSQKDIKMNINKMETLKGNLLRINDKIKLLNDDYKNLYEKYNNNQQYDLDEETDRIVDENIMLTEETKKKQQEIENLLEEIKVMKKDYQNIIMQYEDSMREKNELNQEISELKMNNYKLKGDYEKLLNDIVNKMDQEKKNKKNNKNDNIDDSKPYEEQIREIKSINNSKIDEGEKISRKKGIFNTMSNERLTNYILEIERINQTLSKQKNTHEKKIHELTQKNVDLNNSIKQVKDRNIDLEGEAKKLQKKIDDLKSEVKNNEIFRPSIAMGGSTRISRLSKLNNVGINAQKFKVSNGGGGIPGKKTVEKFKLKDKNINQKILKTPTLKKFENISMDLYGVPEIEGEEEDQDNKKGDNINNKDNNNKDNKNLNKNNNFEINSNSVFGVGNKSKNNNQFGIGGFGQMKFGDKTNSKNAFGINSNNDINIPGNTTKSSLEFESKPSGVLFDGTNTNDINLSQQQGIEINLGQNSNGINTGTSGEIVISNINDINLSSGNNINLGDISSSVIQFDIKNNNNIINDNSQKNTNTFETINNNNMFISNNNKNDDNNKNNNNTNNNKDNINNDNNDDIPVLKIDNLMGEMIQDENKDKNKNNKNNEIKNENSININNDINNEIKKEYDNNDNNINNKLERDRINSVIVNEKKEPQNDNLENIIITGIQKEGFNIDNSSMKGSLTSTNSNNININGEINKKNQKNEVKPSKKIEKEISLDKSTNNFSLSKSQNKNEIKVNNNIEEEDDKDDKSDIFSSINLSDTLNKPIQYNRLSKVELDELRNNNYDYYSLFQEDYMQRRLKEQNDKCHEFNIYSDLIFLLTDKKHLSKRYIVITPSRLYLIDPKDVKFTHIIKKEDILSFQISNKNINILMFQIKDGDNILIETLRRMDLLNYLREIYRTNKNLIKIKYEDKFDIKVKGKTTTVLVKDKIFSNLSNFDGAQKIGYLFVYYGTYIVPIFKEKFFILTSIGLIMFDEPSSPPSKLYPIIGSSIQKIEGTKYNRENCFQVTLLSDKVKIFATRKKRERDSWLKEFEKINKEFQNKMKQLDTINKKIIEGKK